MMYVSWISLPLQIELVDVQRAFARSIFVQLAITSVGQIVAYDLFLDQKLEVHLPIAKHAKYRKLEFRNRPDFSSRCLCKKSRMVEVDDAFIFFKYHFYDWPISLIGSRQSIHVISTSNLAWRLETTINLVNAKYAKLRIDR